MKEYREEKSNPFRCGVYGSYVSLGEKTVLPDRPVTLDLEMVPSAGVSFNRGGCCVALEQEGVNMIEYSILPAFGCRSSVGLSVSGEKIPGSCIAIPANGSQVTGKVILRLEAGAILSMTTCGMPITLGEKTNAFMNIYKICD